MLPHSEKHGPCLPTRAAARGLAPARCFNPAALSDTLLKTVRMKEHGW